MGAFFSSRLPTHKPAVYFPDRTLVGWTDILCCPEAAGCSIRHFDEHHPAGGQVRYYVTRRLSYSVFVPRYEVELRKPGLKGPAMVGRLEREESVLRAKSGEFLRLQMWSIKVVGLEWLDEEGKRRTRPSEFLIKQMTIAISLQARMDHKIKDEEELGPGDSSDPLDMEPITERWVTKFSFDNPAYTVTVPPPTIPSNEIIGPTRHGSWATITQLKIQKDNKLVGVVKKQSFASALSPEETRPYLGVQLKTSSEVLKDPSMCPKCGTVSWKDSAPCNACGQTREVPPVEQVLSCEGLVVLLIALAWSETTMSFLDSDRTPKFVQAFRERPEHPASAKARNWPTDWNAFDVARSRNVDWITVHHFGVIDQSALHKQSLSDGGKSSALRTVASLPDLDEDRMEARASLHVEVDED